jgi:DNA-binding HxlR family transcriptional regulator
VAHHVDSSGGDAYCARFHYAIELIGRRWNGAIIVALHAGRIRYSEVRDTVPGLSDHLLSQRLRELEANGLLERHVTASTPVQVRYELTAMGRALGPVIEELSTWANQWLPANHPHVT